MPICPFGDRPWTVRCLRTPAMPRVTGEARRWFVGWARSGEKSDADDGNGGDGLGITRGRGKLSWDGKWEIEMRVRWQGQIMNYGGSHCARWWYVISFWGSLNCTIFFKTASRAAALCLMAQDPARREESNLVVHAPHAIAYKPWKVTCCCCYCCC